MARFTLYGFSISIAAVIALGGCAGSQNSVPLTLSVNARSALQRTTGSYGAIMYLSGYHVEMLTYPGLQPIGQLKSRYTLSDACTDDSTGDVYFGASIGKSGADELVRYPYGGTKATGVIAPPTNYFLMGCGADPNTGNLAVTFEKTDYSTGYVSVYAPGSKNPTSYFDKNLFAFFTCGYDGSGNLFVLGEKRSGRGYASLVELPNGSGSLVELTLSQPIGYGPLQWDGQYITDQEGGEHGTRILPLKIFRISVSGSSATVVGVTKIRRAKSFVWIQGNTAMGREWVQNNFNTMAFYRYPRGGRPSGIKKGLPEFDSTMIATQPSKARTRH